jgi:phage baseplate assembly protein W
MALYKGFSTYNRTRKFKVADDDLIKQDLFNHFNIRKGEKLMNPGFGTSIWGLLFEPLTEDTRQLIVDDVQSVASYDPRVQIVSVRVSQFDHGINLQVELKYTNTNQTDTMNLQFDNRKTTVEML